MKQFYCNECMNVFKKNGKCKICGSTDIKVIDINIEKQTVRE
jgi:rRNA maturation endonuclease Nob1